MDAPSSEPFSIRDVFADAWRTYTRTFGSHVGWSVAFVAMAILLTCLTSCVMIPAAAIGGIREGGSPFSALAFALLYLVLLVGFFGLIALHQGVTLAIARAEQRGEPVVLGVCVHDASGRLPTMAGVVFARIVADMIVSLPVIAGVLAAAVAIGGTDEPGSGMRSPAVVFGALGVGYALTFAWMLVVRAFLGLASPCAQYEDVGVTAALRRSAGLLAGRRMQLVGLRLVWLLVGGAVYLLGFAPTFVLMPSQAQPSPEATLLVLPMVLVGYLVALQLLSFDSLLEAALYVRITKKRSVDELAQVFR